MDSLHQRAEDLQRIHRIGLAIENEVGGVKVYAVIVESHVVDGAVEGDGRFLAGLAAEVLAIAAAIVGHRADSFDGFLIYRIVGVFWDKSAVSLDGGHAALFGKVGSLLDLGNAGFAILARDQADGERAAVEVVVFS